MQKVDIFIQDDKSQPIKKKSTSSSLIELIESINIIKT